MTTDYAEMSEVTRRYRHVGPFDNDPCDDVSEWDWEPYNYKTIWSVPANIKWAIHNVPPEPAPYRMYRVYYQIRP